MPIQIKKSHRGLLHKNLGVPQGEKIPASKLKIKSTDSKAVKKRKVFAQNAKKWHHPNGGYIDKYDGGGDSQNWNNINTQSQQYQAPQVNNVEMPSYQTSQNSIVTPSVSNLTPNSKPGFVQTPQINNSKFSAGAKYGINFATNLAGQVPQIVNTFKDPNATAGDKTTTTAKAIGDAAVSSIPGFGQFYGLARAGTSAIQGALPSETKYDANTGKPVKVIKSKTAGQKTAAAFDQLLTPDHEHAANSWGLAANAKNTNDKVKYAFQGIGDLFGVTKIARMAQAAKGMDPDRRNLVDKLPTEDILNSYKFNPREEIMQTPQITANGGFSNHLLEKYKVLPHSQLNPNFANAQLDGKPIQLEKNETIFRAANGGNYAFSPNIKADTGRTIAEESIHREKTHSKPYFDKIAQNTTKLSLNDLVEENEAKRKIKEEELPKAANGRFSNRWNSPNLQHTGINIPEVTGAPNYSENLPSYEVKGYEFNKSLPVVNNTSNTNKTTLQNKNNLTTGDYLQLAGSAVAPIANLANFFRKPEKIKGYTDNTPITQQTIAKDYNPAWLAENAAIRDIDNSSTSDAVRRANRIALAGNTQNALNNYSLSVDNANKTLEGQYIDRLSNRARFNSQVLTNRDTAQSQTNAVRRGYLNTAMSQLGQGITDVGKFKNQGMLNNTEYSALQQIASNYGLDPEEFYNYVKTNGKIKTKFKS